MTEIVSTLSMEFTFGQVRGSKAADEVGQVLHVQRESL